MFINSKTLGVLPRPQLVQHTAVTQRGQPRKPASYERTHRTAVSEVRFYRLTHSLWVNFIFGGWYVWNGASENDFDYLVATGHPAAQFNKKVWVKTPTWPQFEAGTPPLTRPDRVWTL